MPTAVAAPVAVAAAGYAWNARAARWTFNGRFASEAALKAGLVDYATAAGREIKDLAARMARGELALPAWQIETAARIKSGTLAMELAAKGGRLTARDYGRLGARLREQYAYLQGFALDVEAGRLTGPQIVARASLYGSAMNGAYEQARADVWRDRAAAGVRVEARNVLSAAEHCSAADGLPGCADEAARGWVPVDEMSTPGRRRCGSNCRCRVEYREAGVSSNAATLSAVPAPSRLLLALSRRIACRPPRPTSDPVVLSLSAAESPPATAIDPPPGMPTVLDGEPVYYRRKRIGGVRRFTHMATGETVDTPKERLSAWATAHVRRAGKGLYPFVYPRHLEAGEQPDANQTLGYVIGVDEEPGGLYAILQMIGEAGRRAAAKNGASVTITAGPDWDGEHYDEFLHHLALTPMAAHPDAAYVPTLAASGAVVMVRNYVCEGGACRPRGADSGQPGLLRTVVLKTAFSGPGRRFEARGSDNVITPRGVLALSAGGFGSGDGGDDWGDATPDEAAYDPALCDLPADWLALSAGATPRVILALNCGTGAGGFQPGNQCAKGGRYGSSAGIRSSRTTKGNITAAGAKKTREYTDADGRKVEEHRTADGRVYHAVTHASGRRSFHQIHGPTKAVAAKGTNAGPPAESTGAGADGKGTGEAGGRPATAGGPVAAPAGGSGVSKAGAGGEGGGQPAGDRSAESVPAEIGRVNAKIDRYAALMRSRGRHEVAGWLDKLKAHVNAVGVDHALASLGPSAGGGEGAQYAGARDLGDFAEQYLARAGVQVVGNYQAGGEVFEGAARDPSQPVVASERKEDAGVEGRQKKGDFFPKYPTLKDKLEEAKHLPGLEASEALPAGTTHLTPAVTAGLDAKYGNGKWIVKAYGDDAAAGYGIFFPQRAEQLQRDARSAIWSAGENLAHYGFGLRRDEGGNVVGLEHAGGDRYDFGSEKYNSTIGGDARYWGDRAAAAAKDERGAALPGGGKDYMAQPAFNVLGASDADRAAGRTWEGNKEGRVHVVTRGGVASAVPHSTWVKGEHLPVVFEDDDTRAMAKAATDAVNALPAADRAGQIYAPDVVKTATGYKVVEANPTNATGGSGYLGDNPMIIDAYVSHLTGRDPAHVAFVRKLLVGRGLPGTSGADTITNVGPSEKNSGPRHAPAEPPDHPRPARMEPARGLPRRRAG